MRKHIHGVTYYRSIEWQMSKLPTTGGHSVGDCERCVVRRVVLR
jgi:hypothetical protein